MNKSKFTYDLKSIFRYILVAELLFWLLFALILWLMDFFSSDYSAGKLAFKKEENLLYLIVLLPLYLAFIWFISWKNKRFKILGEEHVLSLILRPLDSFQVFMRLFLLRSVLAFIILAMAQPIFGVKKVSATLESMELVVSIDVSNSMNTKDIEEGTSRLEVVKRAMMQFVNNLHGEKIGISIFAGGSYLQLPLTGDYEAAKMYIHELSTDMVSNQGTDVAAALDISAKMFSKSNVSKAILLVTDGENHEGELDEKLAILKENNISLAVLGIGTEKGGLIPNNPERPELGHKTDANGRTIVSKMNPSFIKNLAQKAGGFAVISDSAFPDLAEILERFKHMKREKVEGIELETKENWYQIPLLLAMLCFLVYILPLNYSRK